MFKKLGLALKKLFTPKAPNNVTTSQTPCTWFFYEPKAPKNV